MIKDLRDARLVDAVPRVVAGQDWVRALSEAVGVLHERTLRYIDDSQIYTSLDTATEPVLDALAINWKVDWYDTGYSVEQKRRIIKTALTVRRLMGTVGAVKLQADAIYPGTMLEEWRQTKTFAVRSLPRRCPCTSTKHGQGTIQKSAACWASILPA